MNPLIPSGGPTTRMDSMLSTPGLRTIRLRFRCHAAVTFPLPALAPGSGSQPLFKPWAAA
jgi:hypothetical protein